MNGNNPVTYWEAYLNSKNATTTVTRGTVNGDGIITGGGSAVNGNLYYVMDFGAHDEVSGYNGLDLNGGDAVPEENDVRLTYHPGGDQAGDFSDYQQLGDEVEDAVTSLIARHPGARITLVAHSRGGLAARGLLQRAYSSVTKSSIDALVTLGTPHAGSHFGRVFEYLRTSPKNRGTAAQQETRKDDWDLADNLNWGALGGLNVGKPTIRMLSPQNSSTLTPRADTIAFLNNSIGLLPAQTRYGTVLFEKVAFGDVAEGNLFDGLDHYTWWGLKDLSNDAERYILGSTGATARAPHIGDGIVSRTSQDIRNLSGYPGYTLETDSATGVLHAGEEVGQTGRIDNVMGRVKPW